MEINKELAEIFKETARLQEIKGDSAYRINANKKVAHILNSLPQDVATLYKEGGAKALRAIKGIGESSAKKIEQYIKRRKIPEFTKLQEETAIRQIVTHFF